MPNELSEAEKAEIAAVGVAPEPFLEEPTPPPEEEIEPEVVDVPEAPPAPPKKVGVGVSKEEAIRRLEAKAKPPIVPTPAEVEFRAPPVAKAVPTKPDRPGGQVATVDSQKLYITGSTMWELGFRTQQEYRQAQRYSDYPYGIHEGKKVPAGTVVILDKAGKPWKRFEADKVPQSLIGLQYKIPVMTYEGKEKLFTSKAYDTLIEDLNKAEPEQQFTILKEAGIFPKEAAFTGLTPKGDYQYTLPAERVEAKKEVLIVSDAISRLGPYMDENQMVDGARYLRDHPKDLATLAAAGFTQKDIVIWRQYNRQLAVALPVLGWSANLEVQSTAFRNRVTELLVTRPHLSQVDAENIATTEFKAKGLPLKKAPDLPAQIKMANAYFKTLSPAEQAAHLKQAKELPITVAEMFIPGVYVARHWSTLSTQEKVIQIGIDAAFVLTGIGIFRLIGASSKAMAGVTRTVKLANKAGKTGRRLNEAKKALVLAQTVGKAKVGSPLWVKHANNVAKLQQQSVKADRAFLKSLEQLKSISPRQLKQIERVSGLKGISRTVKDISLAEKKLAQAWKRLGKLKFNPNAKTARQIAANNRYLQQLAKVEQAQVRLQATLGRAGSTLKPRYTPSPPATEFKGYGMGWESGKPAPIVDTAGDGTIKAIESYLARNSELKETGREFWIAPSRVAVAVAEKPKVTPKATLKLKAIYEKAKPKPIPKKAVPEVKPSVFPGIKPVVKVGLKPAEEVIPREAFGRMTQAQIAKIYATDQDNAVDVVSKTIEEHLGKLKPFTRISPSTRQAIRTVAQAGVMAMVSAQAKGLTAAEIRGAVSQAVKAQVLTKPALATNAAVVTKTATKVVVAPPSRVMRPLLRVVMRPLLKIPPGASDKEKRKAIKAAKGAIAFNMGEVGKKRVWHTLISPWRPENYVTVIGKAPVGATILVEGENSAYRTAQLLYGEAPSRRITMDIGFMDVGITARGRKINLNFTPDPKGLTTGEIRVGISKGMPPITERSPRLSGRGMPRITPKRPKLRR